jgi:hypothetical protein
MRTNVIVLVAILSAATALPNAAQAQFSPRGMLNTMTAPFRMMMGRFGHFPRHRRREAGMERAPGEAAAQQPNERLGHVGPPAWPNAYEDVVGYAFWPDEYVQSLHGHGFDVIADTITGRLQTPPRTAQAATTGSAAQSDADNTGACQDTAASDWPSTRLGQTVQLNNTQHDEADKVQQAVTQSAKTLKSDCSDIATLPAPERLRALIQDLWNVHDAGMALRTSVKSFDDSLTSTQKMSFTSKQPQEAPKADAKNVPAANKMYQACAQPNVEEAERMIKQIEMRVRPTREQAASFENLHKTSSDMAKMLMQSCAQPIPADPIARLDAANAQLTAMNYAATTVQVALADFYARLNPTQKAHLDSSSR